MCITNRFYFVSKKGIKVKVAKAVKANCHAVRHACHLPVSLPLKVVWIIPHSRTIVKGFLLFFAKEMHKNCKGKLLR